MISFSPKRQDLTAYHLQKDIVDLQYRPHFRLLTDHLTQGVWKCCRYPGSTHGGLPSQIQLDPLSEDVEGSLFEYDESQEGDPMHTATSLTTMGLDSRGFDGVTRAYTQISQFNMSETERGEGKAAFEDYLQVALSMRNNTIPIL